MEQKIITVNMGEIKKAEYPNSLYSGEFGPCFVVVLYNHSTKRGYMIHESSPEYAVIKDRLQKIKQDCGDLSRVNVFVRGNALYSCWEDTNDVEIQRRKSVENIIKKYFKHYQIQTRWLSKNQVGHLLLDTLNKRLKLETRSVEDRSNKRLKLEDLN